MKRIRLAAHPEGGYFCRPLPQYRDTGHWPPAVAETAPTAAEVARWRVRWGATCSDKVAAVLCALERDYAPR